MRTILLLILSFIFFTGATFAQGKENKIVLEANFVPDSFLNSSPSLHLTTETEFTVRNLKTITFIGGFFNSIKFNSPFDEFNAIAPFDIRALTPISVSSFELQLRNNYLLTNPFVFTQ